MRWAMRWIGWRAPQRAGLDGERFGGHAATARERPFISQMLACRRARWDLLSFGHGSIGSSRGLHKRPLRRAGFRRNPSAWAIRSDQAMRCRTIRWASWRDGRRDEAERRFDARVVQVAATGACSAQAQA